MEPRARPSPAAPRPTAHPNGVVRIDHVVFTSPDIDRTTGALAAAGIAARRTRNAGQQPDGTELRQRFFRLGEVILELVGPAVAQGESPARFWGLAHAVSDIDAAVAVLGDRISPVRDAVQPGRQIATLRRGALSVSSAFISDHHA